MIPAFVLALAVHALAQEGTPTQNSAGEFSQDITVRARAAGPGLAVPPPAPSRPVVDEVIGSLGLGLGVLRPGIETIRVSPETSRLTKPFPELPFLALSPENIRALYDQWTFEVQDEHRTVWRTEGAGLLRERLDWDGVGTDGRLIVAPGRSYHYRFIGQRGSRSFAVESDPVTLKSFTRREYVGETRLEVSLGEIFLPGKSVLAPTAETYLEILSDRLRLGEPRADKSYRLELYVDDHRGRLAQERAQAIAEYFAHSLRVSEGRLMVAVEPVERAEALAAFIPPAKGPRLGIE